MPPKRINPDPKAWARKYFIAASFSWLRDLKVIRGINDIRFSSNPIHVKIQ